MTNVHDVQFDTEKGDEKVQICPPKGGRGQKWSKGHTAELALVGYLRLSQTW